MIDITSLEMNILAWETGGVIQLESSAIDFPIFFLISVIGVNFYAGPAAE